MTEKISTRVDGYCPACGFDSLMLSPDGFVTCSDSRCPRPTAVDEILSDPETSHVVTLNQGDFLIRHPLRERLDNALERCPLHAQLAAMDRPPMLPGRYRVTDDGRRWQEVHVGRPPGPVQEVPA